MTLDSLQQFGIEIKHDHYRSFQIRGEQQPKARNYLIEGDWSSAAYWLVASALGLDISVSGLNTSSLQADRRILDVFLDAGCNILRSDSLEIDGRQRKAFEADLTHCPDLFPALAAFASLTPGKSVLKGTQRLLHKESNRAQAIYEEFSKLGCRISLQNDEMHIEGVSQITGSEVYSRGDHRIAMSLAVLALFSDETVTIKDAESVSKSYPSFWEDLERLRLT